MTDLADTQMTRRSFLSVGARLLGGVAATSVLSSCAGKALPVTDEKDKELAWPEGKSAPDYLKQKPAHGLIPRYARSQDGKKILTTKDGEPLLQGLSTPPIKLKGDTEYRVYETIFEKPVTLKELEGTKQLPFVATSQSEANRLYYSYLQIKEDVEKQNKIVKDDLTILKEVVQYRKMDEAAQTFESMTGIKTKPSHTAGRPPLMPTQIIRRGTQP